jgi:hypothetical protein
MRIDDSVLKAPDSPRRKLDGAASNPQVTARRVELFFPRLDDAKPYSGK